MGCKQSVKKYVLVSPNPLAQTFPTVNPDLTQEAVVMSSSPLNTTTTDLVSDVFGTNGVINNDYNSLDNSALDNNSISNQNIIDMANGFIDTTLADLSSVGNTIQSDLSSNSSDSANPINSDTNISDMSIPENSVTTDTTNLSTDTNNSNNPLSNFLSSLSNLRRLNNSNGTIGILLIITGVILAIIASRKDRAYFSMIVATVAVVIGIQMTSKFVKNKYKIIS